MMTKDENTALCIKNYRSAQRELAYRSRRAAYEDSRTRSGESILAMFERDVLTQRENLIRSAFFGHINTDAVMRVLEEDARSLRLLDAENA